MDDIAYDVDLLVYIYLLAAACFNCKLCLVTLL
jgi:hypothetical protein